MEDLVLTYGLWGVALVAFLGATLVPVSSEVAVVAAIQIGLPPGWVLLFASVGNALGATTNYLLGRWPSDRLRARLEDSRGGRKALDWARRYGRWSLLGSWLPVVGDPLCLVAGLVRVRPWFFAAVGIGTRIARYVVLIIVLLSHG